VVAKAAGSDIRWLPMPTTRRIKRKVRSCGKTIIHIIGATKLQKQRDAKRQAQRLAKMDALKRFKPIKPGTYYLIPQLENLAKMDALTQKINVIPGPYEDFGASCK
jgi:hypothetical protein